MAKELRHKSLTSSELTETADWEGLATHYLTGGVDNDILVYTSALAKIVGKTPTEVAALLGKGARVYHDAAQSIPNSTTAYLAFNSERWDTDAIHDIVTNNSRLTCKTAGRYLIITQVEWAYNSTGERQIKIMLNGATVIGHASQQAPVSYCLRLALATIYNLAVNDYVETQVYQSSGSSLNVSSSGQYSPEFTMQRIG